MADNNNLVLTVVLVAAAFLLFNGGLTGHDVYTQSCSKEGSTYCKDNNVLICKNGALTGPVHVCDRTIGERCDTTLVGGQTTGQQISTCVQSVTGSMMPQSFSWRSP